MFKKWKCRIVWCSICYGMYFILEFCENGIVKVFFEFSKYIVVMKYVIYLYLVDFFILYFVYFWYLYIYLILF